MKHALDRAAVWLFVTALALLAFYWTNRLTSVIALVALLWLVLLVWS